MYLAKRVFGKLLRHVRLKRGNVGNRVVIGDQNLDAKRPYP